MTIRNTQVCGNTEETEKKSRAKSSYNSHASTIHIISHLVIYHIKKVKMTQITYDENIKVSSGQYGSFSFPSKKKSSFSDAMPKVSIYV